MSDAAPPRFPVPFGKYLLTELIAVGGMAEVYRAKIFGASGFEKDMVVKRILPKYAQNPSFVQMLVDEAKIAVSLTHGNIVPIYELGEFQGNYYIAMEYVEGRTVLDILRDAHAKRHPLPWAYCLGIAAEVARGLAYAHDKKDPQGQPLGLVHRDINPRNIVITPSGEVKILDFGIARASNKRHQTASGVIKGTPGYMSPEQMYGAAIDNRSDVYCLGILLFELLTLRRLFPVWDVNEMRATFEAGPIPPPSTLTPEVPPSVDPVVMASLAQDLTQRYPNAGAFEEALRRLIATSGTAVTSFGLAREVRAIDEAPGAGAPKTQPPLSQVDPSPGPPQPMVPSTHESHVRGADPNAPTLQGQPAVLQTQPMPTPRSAAMAIDSDHSFVISLADGAPLPDPAPLPALHGEVDALERKLTQVFAQNEGLDWAARIGADAEMLALMKATGAAPGAGRRTLLAAGVITAIALAVVFAVSGRELVDAGRRALSGKKQELGVLIVKTTPSGADVTLDGKPRGTTNMKITGVATDEPHELIVAPTGREPIVVQLKQESFMKGDDGSPTFVFDRDLIENKDRAPAP